MTTLLETINWPILIRVAVVAIVVLAGAYTRRQKRIAAIRRHESNMAEREEITRRNSEK